MELIEKPIRPMRDLDSEITQGLASIVRIAKHNARTMDKDRKRIVLRYVGLIRRWRKACNYSRLGETVNKLGREMAA